MHWTYIKRIKRTQQSLRDPHGAAVACFYATLNYYFKLTPSSNCLVIIYVKLTTNTQRSSLRRTPAQAEERRQITQLRARA